MIGRGRMLATFCIAAVVGLAACGGSGDDRVVVFAASSLTEAFASMESEFEARHDGVDVVVNAAGSASLVAQLDDGAPADVLATADERTMRVALEATDLDVEPVVFARNSMVIAVERGNPLDVTGVGDLAARSGSDVVVVLAAPEVPAGAYAAEVLACIGVEVEVASLEQNVRAAAAKVALGEADAALVYRTDLTDDLEAVAIEATCEPDVTYPIVALTAEDGLAQTFVDFVIGSDGAAILAGEGFEAP